MKDQINPTRKKLNLGIDAIGTVDSILSWDKLEACFGASFTFSTETKFEMTKELAVQQGRIHKLLSEKKLTKIFSFQESSKKLTEDIENLIETNDSSALSFISDIIKRETGNEIKAFCDALKCISSTEYVLGAVRPNDLYRDIIRKIVKILLKENISLSLHVQSNLNKFMTELDRQIPETIFPKSSANYIEEGRIRILKDYLRGHLRSGY
ncbi:hypothetical protein OA416_00730 [Paracoccaceae bacterium]|nr:hypothetical protein [Paracoccaceae bacterium]